jgi:hypothetical protein
MRRTDRPLRVASSSAPRGCTNRFRSSPRCQPYLVARLLVSWTLGRPTAARTACSCVRVRGWKRACRAVSDPPHPFPFPVLGIFPASLIAICCSVLSRGDSMRCGCLRCVACTSVCLLCLYAMLCLCVRLYLCNNATCIICSDVLSQQWRAYPARSRRGWCRGCAQCGRAALSSVPLKIQMEYGSSTRLFIQ